MTDTTEIVRFKSAGAVRTASPQKGEVTLPTLSREEIQAAIREREERDREDVAREAARRAKLAPGEPLDRLGYRSAGAVRLA